MPRDAVSRTANVGSVGKNGLFNMRYLPSLVSSDVYTEKYFRNLIKSNRNQIVFTMQRLTWNETDVRLVPKQSENDKYNLISV